MLIQAVAPEALLVVRPARQNIMEAMAVVRRHIILEVQVEAQVVLMVLAVMLLMLLLMVPAMVEMVVLGTMVLVALERL